MNYRHYRHAGDLGDIVWMLPAMKYHPGKLFIESAGFTRQALTPEKYKPLVRLLESQDYIHSVEEYKGQEAINCNLWRDTYQGNYNLSYAQLDALNVPKEITQDPWIKIDNPKKIAKVVVNRSFRYHGFFPIREVPDDAIFIGQKNECISFNAEFNKNLEYYPTNDLLEAAEVIAGSELFIGNNSCCNAICEGMKHNSIVEIFPPNPNVIFRRENVKHYIGWTEKGGQLFTWKKTNG